MKVLGIGDTNDLASMYLRLQEEGHDVRVFASEAAGREALARALTFTDDWRAELPWIREANDGVILFEGADQGDIQDDLRRQGYRVVGGSQFGDTLEKDRAFGMEVLRQAGISTCAMHSFHDFESARAFLRAHPGRYVYKVSAPGFGSWRTFVAELEDGRDLLGWLDVQERQWPDTDAVSFVLMDHVSGIEVGIGAFFDGVRFLRPACLDWEYKRFFEGDLGELTGEMGTVATYRGSERLFEATLGKLEERFRLAGHVGYVNINTIVDRRGVWPLEFTCRFGYPGYSILEPLHVDGYGALFRAIMREDGPTFRTHPGVSVGVVLTVPPFPYPYGYMQLSKGKRIVLRRPWEVDDRPHVHYCEVDFVRQGVEEELTAVGLVGYLMVVTGRGMSCEVARRDAYRRAQNVVVPGLRYRRDIGGRFEREHEQLRAWGWISAE